MMMKIVSCQWQNGSEKDRNKAHFHALCILTWNEWHKWKTENKSAHVGGAGWHSHTAQLFIRKVWVEKTTQMIITAISGSLKIEKNSQANIPVCLFVIMKLLLIIKDNKNKQNNTSSYNMSVRIADPHVRFFFCSQSDSLQKDWCTQPANREQLFIRKVLTKIIINTKNNNYINSSLINRIHCCLLLSLIFKCMENAS